MSEIALANRSVSLLWLLDGIATIPATAVRVDDLTLDSREVRPGSLFCALRGHARHGLQFALQAAERGASAVLWESAPGIAPPALPASVYAAPVPGLEALMGRIADRMFDWPSAQLRIFGITGTNGKTTCAYLLAQSLERLGSRAAYVGTLGWGSIAALAAQPLTTPDVASVHRTLARLRAGGVRDVAIEVSSHALAQNRVAGVRFHSAAFTNLSRDHLDYHGSMEAYGKAKARLLDCGDLRQIIINVGDAYGRELAQAYGGRVPLTAVWVGAGGSGWLAQRTVHAAAVESLARGLSLQLDGTCGRAALQSKLIGRFNAENLLVVLGCLVSLGVPLAAAAAALAQCAAPPGRMEVIAARDARKALVVIDYAHTPDALAKVLGALREHCGGALWCVFGCGGDRDAGKRPLMGAAADDLADRIIVTDDNPRSEDPARITHDIGLGIRAHTVRIIHDRAQAIATALGEAAAADIVLIAGKGHETYQVYGTQRREFSDHREALRHLGEAA